MCKMRTSVIISAVLFVITLVLAYFNAPLFVLFTVIILTLVKASHLLGNATEELANYYSSTIGGLMNATLGNLAELIIGFFALKEGLVEVVKASLTGSILGNTLLVFGTAVIFGGFKKKELFLNKHEAEVSSTMLLLAVLFLLFPSLLFFFNEESQATNISFFVAGALLLLYFLSLVFSLHTHKKHFVSASHEKPKITKMHAFILMFFSIVILVIVSEMFAGKIEAIAHALNFGELFIGAVLVGVAGNAAEHLGAIQFAIKNKMSLVLNTTIGSSLQIAMFVAPVFVFVSFFMGNFMNLTFLPIEIVSIFAAVLLMNEISRDGCVNWLEGAQLLALYVIICVMFFFHV